MLSVGFEDTSMDAVAASARTSKGTLYARYPTKQALRRAVVMEELNQLSALTAAQFTNKRPADLKERLQQHARHISSTMLSPEVQTLDRLIGDANRRNGDLAELLNVKEQAAIKDIVDDIVDGARSFPVPPRNPSRVAEMLMSALFGWHVIQDRVGPIPLEDALHYADHVVDVLFAGRADW